MAVCDNRHCPEKGFVVEMPNERDRRCHVCGWLMSIIPAEEEEE